ISELARSRGIKVLLSGAGGDDLFTGYRRHSLLAFDGLWSKIPLGLRRGVAGLAAEGDGRRGFYPRRAPLLALASEDDDRRITASFIWGPPEGVDALLSPESRDTLEDDDVEAPLTDEIADVPSLSALEKCLKLEKRFFLADHNLIYTDKMAM